MKSYTDIEQSKKLAKILPLESADMRYGYIAPYDYSDRMYDGGYDEIPYPKDFLTKNPNFSVNEYDAELPCWSLAALMNILPKYELNNFGDTIQLGVNLEALATEGDETLVDLVVNMIIHLHGLKQKPDNKVEPKFHEGEWLVHNERKNVVKVVNATPLVYKVVNVLGYHHTITDTAIENNYHLWTIQDARDGDVLVAEDKDKIFIYNGKLDLRGRVCAYCGIYKTHDGLRFTKCAIGNYFTYKEPYPATEEQRDALMKAMADAGYTFNFREKELKKI